MNKKGFTLVELLVVITIIGLLTVIAVPSALTISKKVKRNMMDSKIELIESGAIVWGQNNKSEIGDVRSSNCDTSIKNDPKVTNCVGKTIGDMLNGENTFKEDYIVTDEATGEKIKHLKNPTTDESINDCFVDIYIKNKRVYAKYDTTMDAKCYYYSNSIWESAESGTLLNAIKKNNGVTRPKTPPGQEVSSSTEAVLASTLDDLGTSYYYRGNVQNNYLQFNNMCWRIVRIEGDGAVKITLAAEKKCSEITSSDTTSAFIAQANYGYTNDYVTNSSGQTSSSIKQVADYLTRKDTNSMKYKLDAWLKASGIDQSKLKKDTWCLGNKTDGYDNSGKKLPNSVNDLIYNGTSFYYETYVRLYGKGQTASATLKCNGQSFTSYIGALTADEVVFAGAKANSTNQYFYLRANAQQDWWTLSLNKFNGSSDYAFELRSTGHFSTYLVYYSSDGVRPAITLNPGNKITKGTGTKTDPYIVA